MYSEKPILKETVSKVIKFYESENVSTLMPGKKDTVSVKNSDGIMVLVQKRLLMGNLKEVYKKFKSKNPDFSLGLSSFASLRPKHCVVAGSSGTHSVCVCPTHENMRLMITGIYIYI